MLIEHLQQQQRKREAAGLARSRVVAHSACLPHQAFDAHDQGPRELLSFCSNDYLGLASHPDITKALIEGARLYGVGSGASHLVSGHSRAHEELEQALSALYAPFIPGCRALVFSSGYMANLAVLTALGDGQACTLSDKLNHACLVDGVLLARAPHKRYVHADMDMLADLLAQSDSPIKLIVSDAVFSMDGDLAPLEQLLSLAQRYDAFIVLDDAHGFGVLGARGEGSLSHAELSSERFILMGTLGKAAGVAGAFVAAHPAVIEHLLQTGRSYVYTTASPPALAHAAQRSIQIISSEEGVTLRGRLAARIAQFREGVARLLTHPKGNEATQLLPSFTAIQAIVLHDNARVLAASKALEALGMKVVAIRPPTVPQGTARLRVSLSAAHTEADVDALLAALASVLAEV